MTITTNDDRDEYTATSGQTVFNYTFRIYESTDLNVYQTPAGQAFNDSTDIITAYTVSGVNSPGGGSITLNSGAATGDRITIVSDIPSSRTTDYQVSGDFTAATVNEDIDRTVSLQKQAEGIARRSVLFPQSEQGVSAKTLDTPDALKYWRWKSDNSGVEYVDLPTISTTDSTFAVDDYPALKALSGQSNNQLVGIAYRASEDDGGGGQFRWDSSDNSASVTADPGQGIYVPPNSDTSGASGCWVRQFNGKIKAVWWGIDGTETVDNLTAAQRAANYGNANRLTVEWPSDVAMRIDSTLVIPAGWNSWVWDGNTAAISNSSTSNARGAFVWHGSSNDIIVDINKQDSSVYSSFDGIAVVNSINGSAQVNATGVTGVRIRDNTLSGSVMRFDIGFLSIAKCETGLQIGDEEGGDGSGLTNFDEATIQTLKIVQCGQALKVDSSGADNNTFQKVVIEGSYTDVNSGYAGTDKKVEIRKSGTNNVIEHLFINCSDINADGDMLTIEAGDWLINNVDYENQDNGIRAFTVSSPSPRGNIVFKNWKSKTNTSSPAMRDSSNLTGNITGGGAVTLENCFWDGDIQCQRPVTAIDNNFTTGYGFVEVDSQYPVTYINKRTRTANGVALSADSETRIPVDFHIHKGQHIDKTKNAQLISMADSTLVDVVTFDMPDDSAFSATVEIMVFGPNATATSRACNVGIYKVIGVSDNGGVINSAVTEIAAITPALNGYASLTLATNLVNDTSADTVKLQVSQTNNLGANAFRGVVKVINYNAFTNQTHIADPSDITMA